MEAEPVQSWAKAFPAKKLQKKDIRFCASCPKHGSNRPSDYIFFLAKYIPWDCIGAILQLCNTKSSICITAAEHILHKVQWEAPASTSGTDNTFYTFLDVFVWLNFSWIPNEIVKCNTYLQLRSKNQLNRSSWRNFKKGNSLDQYFWVHFYYINCPVFKIIHITFCCRQKNFSITAVYSVKSILIIFKLFACWLSEDSKKSLGQLAHSTNKMFNKEKICLAFFASYISHLTFRILLSFILIKEYYKMWWIINI